MDKSLVSCFLLDHDVYVLYFSWRSLLSFACYFWFLSKPVVLVFTWCISVAVLPLSVFFPLPNLNTPETVHYVRWRWCCRSYRAIRNDDDDDDDDEIIWWLSVLTCIHVYNVIVIFMNTPVYMCIVFWTFVLFIVSCTCIYRVFQKVEPRF